MSDLDFEVCVRLRHIFSYMRLHEDDIRNFVQMCTSLTP
jgi:hypothetical protein